ncbi:MAG: permease-like cell division protein FtsX [candidate division Zixibacteria bacterium]|nr:permease-like cell division protein FtsX [candidate division Zixibacteria bacterium]
MSRILFSAKKSWLNIFRRPLVAAGTFLSLCLLFILFDLIWTASLSTKHYYDRQISNIDIEIFLDDNLTDSTTVKFRESIGRMDGVEKAEYISRDDARSRLYDLMGIDLLGDLDENPLPRSIIISFKENFLDSRRLQTFKENLQKIKGISQIFYAEHWLEKAELAKSLVAKTIYLLGMVIFLAALLNVIHSIQFSLRMREEEITQLRLLGAGRSVLIFPYIFEGLFYSLLAAAAGWIIIFYGIGYFTFRDVEIIFPSLKEIVYFCLAAGALGLLGGYMGSRQTL